MSNIKRTKHGHIDYLSKVECISKHSNTLDTMIRKEPGMYQCLDCVSKTVERQYLKDEINQSNFFSDKLQAPRLKKLQRVIAWAIG